MAHAALVKTCWFPLHGRGLPRLPGAIGSKTVRVFPLAMLPSSMTRGWDLSCHGHLHRIHALLEERVTSYISSVRSMSITPGHPNAVNGQIVSLLCGYPHPCPSTFWAIFEGASKYHCAGRGSRMPYPFSLRGNQQSGRHVDAGDFGNRWVPPARAEGPGISTKCLGVPEKVAVSCATS